MSKHDRARLARVSVGLPFGIGKAEWEADKTERRAAWALYVELVTRVAVEPLPADKGLLREALSSLNSLFGSTREVLREAGPAVGARRNSVGGIAIAVLNRGLRPFLTGWHPELQQWEATRPRDTSPFEHEAAWPRAKAMRDALEALRRDLAAYAAALAAVAGIDDAG
jgi:hypothetical protein